MSRVRKATFTPEYRLERIERVARSLGMNFRRINRTIEFEADDGSRLYRFRLAGRTNVRIEVYVPDEEDGNYVLEAEATMGDEAAQARLVTIERTL
jgi:hypothetical protein